MQIQIHGEPDILADEAYIVTVAVARCLLIHRRHGTVDHEIQFFNCRNAAGWLEVVLRHGDRHSVLLQRIDNGPVEFHQA